MRRIAGLVGWERRAQVFVAAYLQSSLGTGAAAVGLVVLAYERYRSPWAITLVLLANFVPGMLLGPVFGAAADRWPRRTCMVAADVARALAFIGIAAIDSFPAMVAFALLAGAGTAVFSPAALSSLPGLVGPGRGDSLTSLYSGAGDTGRTLGPLVAAAAFPLVGATGLMAANAATFLVSATALSLIRFAPRAPEAPGRGRPALLAQAREGVVETAGLPIVRVIVWASAAATLFAAMLNVAELLLARGLGASAAGFSLLVAACGAGVIAGSLAGSRPASVALLRRRFLAGVAAMGLSLLFLSVVPSLALAVPAFAIAGFANGLINVHERLLVQRLVPDRLMARAFAALDTLAAWAFTLAFVAAGALIAALGASGVIGLAGGGCLVAWAVATAALSREAAAEPYIEASTVVATGVEREASTARTASL